MLKTRIMTAIALVFGFLIALFNTSDFVWALLTLGVTLLGIWEWSNLVKLNKAQMLSYLGLALGVGLLILFIQKTWAIEDQHQINQLLLGGATIFWVAIAPILLITRKLPSQKLVMCLLGLLLLITTWLGFVGLHNISPWLLLAVIATVNIADTAAYFFGKRFGRHKLAPAVSPGKTWEGVAGALVAVSVYGVVLCSYLGYSLWLIVAMWGAVVLSVMGDLFESLLKRQAGIKDSSQLLPGHGGVLDRIDGLIPTLAIALFCTYLPFFLKIQAHG